MKKTTKAGRQAADLRRLAEQRLRRETEQTDVPELAEETQRLVHELQVHQIELEMQNEELQRTRAEVEAILAQYTDLYDFAPVATSPSTARGRSAR